jgi:hypothetical protein
MDHELARRLLAHETAGREDAAEVVAAAERVLRRVYEHLGRWFGSDGIHAVLTRALAHARRSHPALAHARIATDGELLLHGAEPGTEAADPAEVASALTAMIAATIAVLERLLGEGLLLRLVHQIWPGEMSEPTGSDGANDTKSYEARVRRAPRE